MNIFIDLDGPILNNLPRLYQLYCDLTRSIGIPPIPQGAYWRSKRERVSEKEILHKSGCFNERLIAEYEARRYRKIESAKYLILNKLTSGCCGALDFLSQKGNLVLITTRKNKRNLSWEINRKKISHYFSAILCDYSDQLSVGHLKQQLIRSYRNLNASDARDIIIGDTEAEIECGSKLNIFSIALTNGIRKKSELLLHQPDFICRDLVEAVKNWHKIERKMTR